MRDLEGCQESFWRKMKKLAPRSGVSIMGVMAATKKTPKRPTADALRAITVRVSRDEYDALDALRGDLHMTQLARRILRNYAQGTR